MLCGPRSCRKLKMICAKVTVPEFACQVSGAEGSVTQCLAQVARHKHSTLESIVSSVIESSGPKEQYTVNPPLSCNLWWGREGGGDCWFNYKLCVLFKTRI